LLLLLELEKEISELTKQKTEQQAALDEWKVMGTAKSRVMWNVGFMHADNLSHLSNKTTPVDLNWTLCTVAHI